MRWLRFPRVLGIVVCLYLIGMAAVFGGLSMEGREFVHNAASTTGTVTALVVRPPAGSARATDRRMISRAPTVHYEVGGRGYDYTAAHGRYRPRVSVGQTVTVLYNPDDPAQARLRGEGQVLVPGIAVGFLASAVVVGIVLIRTRRLGSAEPVKSGRPGARSHDEAPVETNTR